MGFLVQRNKASAFCEPSGEPYRSEETTHGWGGYRPRVAVATQPVQPNWQKGYDAALKQLAEKLANGRLEKLEREILDIKEHCKQLRDVATFSVPVETLSPEPFVVKKPFHVVVRPSDGEFIATLFDANLSMTGDTAEEAVASLKATIVDTFELFEENEKKLGPEPERQLAILRELIQRQK